MSAAADKATDPRGLKRICTNCGIRFYDMNNRPIVCPSCETEFTGEVKVKTRRSKIAAAVEADDAAQGSKAKEAETANDDGEEEEDAAAEAEIVSLDDLETAEKTADDDETPSTDIDLDTDDDLDEIEVADDDLGDLQDLEPDAEIEEEEEAPKE